MQNYFLLHPESLLKRVQIFLSLWLLAAPHHAVTGQSLDKIHEAYEHLNAPAVNLAYVRLRFDPYQSYDFRKPDSLISEAKVQIQLDQTHFVAHSTSHFPGDYHFQVVEYQNENESVLYDSAGLVLGKDHLNQSLDRYQQLLSEFTPLYPLLLVKALKSGQILSESEGTNRVEFQVIAEGDTNTYVFLRSDWRLLLYRQSKTGRHWEYSYHDSAHWQVERYDHGQLKHQYEMRFLSAEELPLAVDHTRHGQQVGIDQTPYQLEPISANLYVVKHVAGDRNVMFYTDENAIQIFGAPISEASSEAVISLIQKHFPQKEIERVYITHAHSDHMRGLVAYFKRNIPVLTDGYTREAVQQYPPFAAFKQQMKFMDIHQSQSDHYQFHFPESSHVLSESFVYFPQEQVIYQGDFLQIPADNSLPNYLPKTSAQFIEYLSQHELKVERIVAHHRNAHINMALLRRYQALHK